MQVLTPTSATEVAEIVRDASAIHRAVRIDGHGSKRAIGHDVTAAIALDMTALDKITLYEPEELVLSAEAGAPLAMIAAELARNGQDLAFEPMDYGPLLGQPAGRGTLGGLLAANLSGPRRIAKGATRDHMLGLHAVTGDGKIFKAGGRVVKNVTGFDLARGFAGSWGTLAVFTEVTLKVLPRPETSASLVLADLAPETAVTAMAAALGSSADVSGAAYLPGGLLFDARESQSRTVLRLEGTPVSVAARVERLRTALAGFGVAYRLDDDASRDLWQAIRDARAFWPDEDQGTIWRISVAPSAGSVVAETIRSAAPSARYFLDWQGGLIWLSAPESLSGMALRAIVSASGGGAATRIRGSAEGPAFPPPDAATATLLDRLKARFDPKSILEPGRMGR